MTARDAAASTSPASGTRARARARTHPRRCSERSENQSDQFGMDGVLRKRSKTYAELGPRIRMVIQDHPAQKQHISFV